MRCKRNERNEKSWASHHLDNRRRPSKQAKALHHFFIDNILFAQLPPDAEDVVDPDGTEGRQIAHSDDLFVVPSVNRDAGATGPGAFDCACACAAVVFLATYAWASAITAAAASPLVGVIESGEAIDPLSSLPASAIVAADLGALGARFCPGS